MAGWLLGVSVVLLCVHVAVLMVVLVRAALPGRRQAHFALGMLAGAAALVGELVLLGRLYRPDDPVLLGPALVAASLVLALLARAGWRTDAAGRVAWHALLAAPLAALLLVALVLSP